MNSKHRRTNRWGLVGIKELAEGKSGGKDKSDLLSYTVLHEQKIRAQREIVRQRVMALTQRGDTVRRVGSRTRRDQVSSIPLRKSIMGTLASFPREVPSPVRIGKGNGKGKAKHKNVRQRFRGKYPERYAAGHRRGGVRVTETWVNGRLTNHAGFRAYVERQEGRRKNAQSFGKALNSTEEKELSTASTRWYERHRKGREPWLRERRAKRPGLVVLLDATTQEVARKEAQICGIPTVGWVPIGTQPSGRTYPRPMPGHRSRKESTFLEGGLLLGRRVKKAVLASVQ